MIVAPGFSCRFQIAHFTGRDAVHPATFLRGLATECGLRVAGDFCINNI